MASSSLGLMGWNWYALMTALAGAAVGGAAGAAVASVRSKPSEGAVLVGAALGAIAGAAVAPARKAAGA